MKILRNTHYMMDMSCGGDTWRLRGEVFNHPRFSDGDIISPSTPISLSPYGENDYQMKTASGSVYIIESPGLKVLEQIRKDIENKGYEVH